MSSCSLIAWITDPDLIANSSVNFYLSNRHLPAATQQKGAVCRFFSDSYPLMSCRCSVTNLSSRWNLNSFNRNDTSVCFFRLNLTCGLDSVPVCVYSPHIDLHPVTLPLLRLHYSFPEYLLYTAYLQSINIFLSSLCCTQMTLDNDLSFSCCSVTKRNSLCFCSVEISVAQQTDSDLNTAKIGWYIKYSQYSLLERKMNKSMHIQKNRDTIYRSLSKNRKVNIEKKVITLQLHGINNWLISHKKNCEYCSDFNLTSISVLREMYWSLHWFILKQQKCHYCLCDSFL